MKTLQYTFIYLLLISKKVKVENVNLVEELLRDGGHWVLAAAASTLVPPPSKSCVRITVTALRERSDCIMVNLNLTVRKVRHVKFIGRNYQGEVEIHSKGPIHEYMIKSRSERIERKEFKNYLPEVDWEAAVNQPLCWRPNSRPRRFVPYRYVVTPAPIVEPDADAVFLVGVKPRMPTPEYETAILTKRELNRTIVQKLVDIFNWKNYEKMRGCHETEFTWPPAPPNFNVTPVPWFWNFFIYCLPRLHIKCALEYDINDEFDPVNEITPHEIFASVKVPSFKDSGETKSIWVKHNK